MAVTDSPLEASSSTTITIIIGTTKASRPRYLCYTSLQNKAAVGLATAEQNAPAIGGPIIKTALSHHRCTVAAATIGKELEHLHPLRDHLQVLIVFAVESLELDFALLFREQHILLRVLSVLVVLATSSEKDSESLYKRVKINRLINIFKNDPVIPAFPDLHLSPAAILKELSMYFPKFSAQARLLTLPSPHELPPREAQEYPLNICHF
ncbi:protein PIR-like [Camellia sinensis]|uniref:protein PIR-like n=1 Tax=Camellia sinensis TaxID=4442 RepID=UPI00103601C4|nr:protein PIR-like [Camellia sinensis]